MQAQAAIRKAVEDVKLGSGGRKDAGLSRLKLTSNCLSASSTTAQPRACAQA